jgi:hypothetical protein
MNEKIIAERVTRTVMAFECQAGENWEITEAVKDFVPQVVREIQKRGGRVGTVRNGKIKALAFYVSDDHLVPIDIQLYEGSWTPGTVIVSAKFGGGHPIPVKARQPFNAQIVVDEIQDAFMSLVAMGRGR